MDKYELNDFRVAVLTKLQGKLHDNLVDQVSSDWSLEYSPLIGHLTEIIGMDIYYLKLRCNSKWVVSCYKGLNQVR